MVPARQSSLVRLRAAARAVRRVVVVEQGRHLRTHANDDGTPAPAVAAVGPAEGLELLAVNGRNPVPAIAGRDVEDHAIDERSHGALLTK